MRTTRLLIFSAAALALLQSPPAARGLECNPVDFEAYADGEPVGTVSGVPAVVFDASWIASVDSDAGGSVPIANEPSPDNASQLPVAPVIDFDMPIRSVELSYSARASALPLVVEAWDGAGGSGSVVASLTLETVGFAGDGAPCSGDPTGGYCLWDQGVIALGADSIRSVTFSAPDGFFGVFFDDMIFCAEPGGDAGIQFTDVSAAAGLDFLHAFDDYTSPPGTEMPKRISGGVAAGDYDGDGDVDLYVTQGDQGPTMLMQNQGDGTFTDVAAAAGVQVASVNGYESGPTFGDIDGDGLLDLVIGHILHWEDGSAPRVFLNQGDGTFLEDTGSGLLPMRENTFSSAFGDYDRDGLLDVFMAHWSGVDDCPCDGHLWRNQGDGSFLNVDAEAGIAIAVDEISHDRVFAPNFADVDNDGWPDLLVASDFGLSQVFLNNGDGTFTEVTDPEVQTDQNGMGAAVGDVDNDGHLDWFISSIWNNDDKTGNRLLKGAGDGTFTEVSESAGVRDGSWGWAACMADFDNDGHLDILHVNGWEGPAFESDASRLFMNDGDGTFTERAADLGLVDTGKGRGLVCFDMDRDGDVDAFVANNDGTSKLWRNDGGNASHWLNVALRGPGGNPLAVGGRLYATAGGTTQMREIAMGSHFASQDPAEAHFGLADAASVDELSIVWPDDTTTVLNDVPGDRTVTVEALVAEPATQSIAGFEPIFFGGCTQCQVEASLEVTGGGDPEPVRAALIGWAASSGTNALAVLDMDLERVVFMQRLDAAVINRVDFPTTLDEGTVYDLRIQFDGSDFHVFLDGTRIIRTPDMAPGAPFGEAGLLPRNAEITRHNLAVTTVRPR